MTQLVPMPQHTTAVAVVEDSRDLAALTEPEFERALDRLNVRTRRMHRILESSLVAGAHYGNPKLSNGGLAFKKPILFLAGAEELSSSFRLQVCAIDGQPDHVTETPEFCAVTVHRAILDGAGRLVDRTTASCSSREKRFKRQDGNGFTFADAREVLNDLWAMAEKRAKVRLVRSALGMTAFLASEEEMESALQPDRPLTPWTDEEKRHVYAAAAARGMGRTRFKKFVEETLGRADVGAGADVETLLAAIEALPKRTASATTAPTSPVPTSPATPPADDSPAP